MLNTLTINIKRFKNTILTAVLFAGVNTGICQEFSTLPALLQVERIYEKAAYDSALVLLQACNTQKKTDQAYKTKLLALTYYAQKNWEACINTLKPLANSNKDLEISRLLCRALAQNMQADEALVQLHNYRKMRHSLASPKEILNDTALLTLTKTKAWDNFWQSTPFADYENLYDDANYEYHFGRTEAAINILAEVLAQKKYLPALLLFARIEWSLGHAKSALSAAEQAYQIGSKNPTVCEMYINYLLLDENKHLAQVILNKSLQAFPYHLEFYRQKAMLHKLENESDLADTYLNYYKTWLPSSLDNWEKLGQAYLSNDDCMEALRYFSRCIAEKPLARYYRQRGLCYFVCNSLKYALTDLAMTIDINPRDAEAWYVQGEVLFKQGDKQSACDKWKRAQQLGSHDALLKCNRYCERK